MSGEEDDNLHIAPYLYLCGLALVKLTPGPGPLVDNGHRLDNLESQGRGDEVLHQMHGAKTGMSCCIICMGRRRG